MATKNTTTTVPISAVEMTMKSPLAKILQEAGIEDDRILLPSDATYSMCQSSYFSKTAQLSEPGCIIRPHSVEEVAVAVRTLVGAKVPFAVRSGGHMMWAKSNSIGNEGVTLDLGRLDWVRVVDGEKDEKLADIGPGNRWGKVYAELEVQGLTVAGGREGNVGVAGLLLGGGIAFYSARYGMSCDNVVEYEVVLTDGRIVKAEAHGDHAELFRALKGGGNNFGIVTNFRMRTLPSHPAWAGMTIHPKETIPQAIEAFTEFADNVPLDLDSNLLCFFTYTDVVVIGALIQVAGVEQAPAYKKWLDMPMMTTTCMMTTIPQLAMDYSQAKGYHNTWFTSTFKNDARVMKHAADLHASLVSTLLNLIPSGDFITQCLFQPFPQLFGAHAREAGGNMLNTTKQPTNGLLWLAVAQVRTPEAEALAYPLVRDWVHAVQRFAADIDANLPFTYLNYADETQDPLSSYGPENVRFMRAVAAKYDPGRVMQTLCPGGFKLDRVTLRN